MSPTHLPGRAALANPGWLVAGALALAVGGCGKAPPAQPVRRAVRIAMVAPREGHGGTRFAGSLEPHSRVDLSFKVPGRLASLLEVATAGGKRPLQEGDRDRRGQVLASLDVHDLSLQERAAAAALDTAVAQVRAGELALAQAEKDVQRARLLAESATIARADLDRAETAHATAKSNLASLEAQRRQRAEQQALARSAVADARLLASIDGVVARRAANVGEGVGPAQPVITVLDTSEMRTVFGIPDVRVGELRDGQRVPVEIDAFPGRVLVGSITKISPVPDPALRSYAVEVTIPNADGSLRSGMVATATLDPAERPPAILVPLSAIARAPGGQGFVVFVVSPEGQTAAARSVQVGDLYDNDVAVEAGLPAGERVVIEGAQFLHDGESVAVVP